MPVHMRNNKQYAGAIEHAEKLLFNKLKKNKLEATNTQDAIDEVTDKLDELNANLSEKANTYQGLHSNIPYSGTQYVSGEKTTLICGYIKNGIAPTLQMQNYEGSNLKNILELAFDDNKFVAFGKKDSAEKTITLVDNTPTVTQITFESGVTSSEPTNCTYTVVGKMCIVNLAGVTDTNTGIHTIVKRLPKCKTRANAKSTTGRVVFVGANQTVLSITDSTTSDYVQLVYAIAD